MTESELIWKFISKEFPDEHIIIYLYVCGNVRSPKTSMDKAMIVLEKIFCPPYDKDFIRTLLKGFLDRKKEQYLKGNVKVNPLY
jgi:hypothetical protein